MISLCRSFWRETDYGMCLTGMLGANSQSGRAFAGNTWDPKPHSLFTGPCLSFRGVGRRKDGDFSIVDIVIETGLWQASVGSN